ncbi:hypothetical protein BG000_010191 [Podila horticola]|nr:hypothetical protein BG000_010191 [Podila horticola]
MSAYPSEKPGGELGYPTNQPPPPPPVNQAYAAGPSTRAHYPGAPGAMPTEFLDPLVPRPNDILPLHPAIVQQRQIAASLPPCPQGGYHELRSH